MQVQTNQNKPKSQRVQNQSDLLDGGVFEFRVLLNLSAAMLASASLIMMLEGLGRLF